jgi:arylsulfatase A
MTTHDTPRVWICAVATAVLATTLLSAQRVESAAEETRQKPNVVLIMTDDQGWGDVHSHGNEKIDTPVMDRLRLQGARFDRFFVSPMCAPTRASLLTGRYNLRTGVSWVAHGKETLRLDEVTIADALKKAGYATGCFGKWHNGEYGPYHPNDRGFDEFTGFCRGAWQNYFDPVLEHNREPLNTHGYITDVLTDAALEFIEKNRDRPFFCYLPYNAPHHPFQVPGPYFEKYTQRGFDEQTACVYGMVENLDENLARILARLDELALTKDTILIFMSDNGPSMPAAGAKGEWQPRYNGGMKGRKAEVDEGGVRVPLFIRWPGHIRPNIEVTQIAAHIDLFPTILQLCDIPLPKTLPLDGRSLVPLLDGNTEGWPERMIFSHQNRLGETRMTPGSVRTQRYRLVNRDKKYELYDMDTDPGQQHDIAGQSPEMTRRLAAAYEAWYADVTSSGVEPPPVPVGYPSAEVVAIQGEDAKLHGDLKFNYIAGWAHDSIVNWRSKDDYVEWNIDVLRPGRYAVTLMYSCPQADTGSRMQIEIGTQRAEATVTQAHDPLVLDKKRVSTSGPVECKEWAPLKFEPVELEAGRATIVTRARSIPGKQAMELKEVHVRRISGAPLGEAEASEEANVPDPIGFGHGAATEVPSFLTLLSGGGRVAADDVPDSRVSDGIYFPPAGQSMKNQDRRAPNEVGMEAAVVERIKTFVAENPYTRRRVTPRWALWRHGRLVHVEGDFQQTVDVASLRKTWHAMLVGAAIKQGRIPSHQQQISRWLPELKGNDALASWRQVLTQSAGFDYPYGDFPDYKPGEMWTYSDLNLVNLCNALARVYGKKDYRDDYADVARQAYFDAIEMEGWSTTIVVDRAFGQEDGVRFVLSLEHMGRLGLLALARGKWNGEELVPPWFVEQLETKQTQGMQSNYQGPNDGTIGLRNYPGRFAESPYGYFTWVNTDRDYFSDADALWAWGEGAGGTTVLWNRSNGVVFAGVGIDMAPKPNSIPRIIERSLTGPNPLAVGLNVPRVGQWSCFETSVVNAHRYWDPYTDVSLDVTYTRPDGSRVKFWGFYDGAAMWRLRFMPDQLGQWNYRAEFSDGCGVVEGQFECIPSAIPGMVSRDESNPMWFGFKGGGHVLLRSLHVGDRFFAENWPAEKRREVLDWAQAQGYNMLSVASHYLNRDEAGRGKAWQTPDLWPLDAAEFRKLELLLDDLAARQIIVYPFAGFFGQSSDFPSDPLQQQRYIRYVLARLGPYWNIVLNVAGPEPLAHADKFRLAMDAATIDRLGNEIHELDVFDHLISIHNRPGDDPFKDASWLGFGTLQGWNKDTDWDHIHLGMLNNHHSAKPLYAQEVFWPGNKYHHRLSDDDIRKKAFVLMMSATAFNFADMNGDSSSGFSGTLELADKVQLRHDIVKHVWDFMETVPFYQMVPRQDLVDNGYCLADEGQEYLVYLPTGGNVSVAIKPGSYRVEWINARETSDRRSSGTTRTGKALESPQTGDWLLRLRQQPAAGDNTER